MLIDRFLNNMVREGEIEMDIGGAMPKRIGAPVPGQKPIRISLKDRATARAIVRNPALGAAEAFMDGRLCVADDDIWPLLDLIGHNVRWDWSNKNRVRLWRNTRWLNAILPRNDGTRAKANVAHHYDLSDRLYALFLDTDWQYSCAYFDDPANDLDDAQQAKLTHIAAKLALQPGQRVLDIGCGWGGLALYLHKIAGVEVLGITLSEEQLSVARARAQEAGVADKVRFELIDYRDVSGTFDRIVSVGMFEHVGRKRYRNYFETIRDRLADDGIALVHTIMRADGPGKTDPFTTRYIFPGGYCPALSEVLPAIEQSWLWVSDIEILRLHYAYTLEQWYARVRANRAEIVALYDERFYRMWCFYLASAIMAFRHDGHCNAQIQLLRRRDAAPITRDYMFENEIRLRAAGKS